MKLSPLEEYGLRCLVQIARKGEGANVTISELSDAQNLTMHNVAKVMRLLRRNNIVVSERGHNGGYKLSHPSEHIVMGDVLEALGGRLVDDDFCSRHFSDSQFCLISDNCSVRTFWSSLQQAIDRVVYNTTLADFLPGFRSLSQTGTPIHQSEKIPPRIPAQAL